MLTLEKVIESMPDVNFYWAGDGQYKNKILKVLDKFDNFHWLGPLSYPDKVREFLSEIDIYAIITGMDTTPLSLKEAQLMQVPVIGTDVGGISETMKDGETGFLVREGGYKNIIEKISMLINDKEFSVKMGARGRRFIQEDFSLEASAKNFLDVVKSYINNKN
jgi:glycosyltransferase involved in cell wall biosynthesis